MNKGLAKSNERRDNNLKQLQLHREYNANATPIPSHQLKASQLENIVDIDEIISPLIKEYSPEIRKELERLAGKDSAGDTKYSLSSLRKEDCRIKCRECDDGWVDVSENLEQKKSESESDFLDAFKKAVGLDPTSDLKDFKKVDPTSDPKNLDKPVTLEMDLGSFVGTNIGIERSEYSCYKCDHSINNIKMEIGRSERFHRISECTIRSILLSVLENPIATGNDIFWLLNNNDERVPIKLPRSNRCLWMKDRDAAKQSIACPQCESPVGSPCKSEKGRKTITHKKRVYQYYETEDIEEPHSSEGNTLKEIMDLQYNEKIQRHMVEELLKLASQNNTTINIDDESWIVRSSSSQKEGGSFRALGLNMTYKLGKEIKKLISDEKAATIRAEATTAERDTLDRWCARMALEIIYAITTNLKIIELKSPRYMIRTYAKDKKKQRDSSSTMIQTCTKFTKKIIESISENELKRIREQISRECTRPMIVPPLPWRKDSNEYVGGYLLKGSRHTLISKASKMSGTKHPQFEPSEKCLDALNALQQTRWGINNGVVNIVEKVLDNKINYYVKTLLKLTLENNKFVATITDYDYSYLLSDSVREWKDDIKFAKEDAKKQLYHVYNMDYRGRVYTTAHRLDPQGDDVSRAMLTFSDPVILNERGWYWLRVHTIAIWQGRNSSKYEWIPEKGMTLDEMAEWANRPDFIRAMEKIANKPMDHLPLWADGDIFSKKCEGFQRIAITNEFHNIIENTSGKGVGGTSHLPIRQDASSNIYQHQAMLLKDKDMAEKVNVIPNEEGTKSDVYELIAENVELDFTAAPLSELTTEQQKEIRELVKQRSTAKGPVMTVGYGAKQLGIKEAFLTHNGKSIDGGGRLKKVWIKNDLNIIQQQVNELKDSCVKLSDVELIDEQGYVLWNNIRNALEIDTDINIKDRRLNKEELKNIKDTETNGNKVVTLLANIKSLWEEIECAHNKSKLANILSNVSINKHAEIAMVIAKGYMEAIKIVLPHYNMIEKRMKEIYDATNTGDYDYQKMTQPVLKKKLKNRGLATSMKKLELTASVKKHAEKDWLEKNNVSAMTNEQLKTKLKELNQKTSTTNSWLIECLKENDEDSEDDVSDDEDLDSELYTKWTVPDGSKVSLISLERSKSEPVRKSDYLRNEDIDKDIIREQVNELKDSCVKLSDVELIDENGYVLWNNIRSTLEIKIDDNSHEPLNKNELERIKDTETNGNIVVKLLEIIANRTNPASISIRIKSSNRDKESERRATPPGFIHSYDACHLRSIALHMKKIADENEKPFQFWGVHDSFGVGANDVDEMRRAIINELVNLYHINPFNRFLNNQKIKEWVDLDPIGTLDISEVGKVNGDGYPLSEWFVGP